MKRWIFCILPLFCRQPRPPWDPLSEFFAIGRTFSTHAFPPPLLFVVGHNKIWVFPFFCLFLVFLIPFYGVGAHWGFFPVACMTPLFATPTLAIFFFYLITLQWFPLPYITPGPNHTIRLCIHQVSSEKKYFWKRRSVSFFYLDCNSTKPQKPNYSFAIPCTQNTAVWSVLLPFEPHSLFRWYSPCSVPG